MAGRNNGSGMDFYELRRKHEEYLMAKRAQEEATGEAGKNAPPQEDAAPAAEQAQAAVPAPEAAKAPEAAADMPDTADAADTTDAADTVEDAPEETGANAAAEAVDEADRDEGYDDYDDEDEAGGGLFEPVLRVVKNAYSSIAGSISRKHARSDDVLDDSDDSYSDEDFSEFESGENQERHGLLRLFRRRKSEDDFDLDDAEPEDDANAGENDFAAVDDTSAGAESGEAADEAEEACVETAENDAAATEDCAYVDEPAEDTEAAGDIEDIEDIEDKYPGAEAPIANAGEYTEAPAFDAEDIAVSDAAVDDLPEDADPLASGDDPGASDEDEYVAADDDGVESDGTAPAQSRGFGKRVLDLFIRIERDDVYDEDDYEVDAPGEDEDDRPGYDDSLFVNDHRPYHGEEEIIYMEDQTKKTPDLTELMSDGMDEKILSRRERRELRMKQEAAAAANAESASEAPAAPELSADSIVPDEPTREYQIVTRASKEEPAAEPVSDDALFMDEDEAEEESVKKPARNGLFGRSRKAAEDDYDDDYDEDDEDDEDDEPVKPRKTRGRKARKYEDDYEDDYDEDEDYDDDDYDDEPRSRSRKSRRHEDDYDDYDDDDYYDDYDDDDDAPGAGHYVLGFIKLIVALALILVVVVFGMYFADQAIEGGFAPYRFISEKVPFIGEYLPATEQAPALADPATLTGNDADMNGGADAAATGEPEVTSEPDNVTDGASDEGVTTDETEPESVG